MRQVLLFMSVLFLASCGSMKTVTSSNHEIGSDLQRNKTKCESTTRVYSGVTYDFCRFHANESGLSYNEIILSFYLFDMVIFSPIVDTLLLPVTIYQQVSYGNSEVYRSKK